MNVVETSGLTQRFGRITALRDVSLAIPEGIVYALLGPNGAGKTTLLHILMGLARPNSGRVAVLGKDPLHRSSAERAQIGYVAEGQRLPAWMTLRQLAAYLAPLYPTWDASLAAELRSRFRLDETRKVGTLSRGESMKAALLCALAPRPRLLLMDEPFTGMDVAVKDELVRGLLSSAQDHGWSVVISSHDIAELEPLADWVGFLDGGRLRLSEPMEDVFRRFRQVDVSGVDPAEARRLARPNWLSVERAGTLLRFIARVDPSSDDREIAESLALPQSARVELRPASLREIFIALANETHASANSEPERVEVGA
jgi:ABC-2 type transport system ATP-binding protein